MKSVAIVAAFATAAMAAVTSSVTSSVPSPSGTLSLSEDHFSGGNSPHSPFRPDHFNVPSYKSPPSFHHPNFPPYHPPYAQCNPPEYACSPDFSSWYVCNTDGYYIFAGECGYGSYCYYYDGLPYCS